MGAAGVGALMGAVILAARRSVLGLGRLIAIRYPSALPTKTSEAKCSRPRKRPADTELAAP